MVCYEYETVGCDQVNASLKALDTDGSGDVDEVEWCINLQQCPKLKEVLRTDLDPDTGKLRSYRSPRRQFAKLLGNIDRSRTHHLKFHKLCKH